jgi:hypothetical protein
MKTIGLCLAALALATSPALAEDPPVTVSTIAELRAALASAVPGQRIVALAGDYPVSTPLVVPDGVTLVGEGVMQLDEAGLPAGFGSGPRTRLRAAATLVGDILTLHNGVTVQGLTVEDVLRGTRLRGNVVVVSSRWPGDTVAANVVECELIDPNTAGAVPLTIPHNVIPSGPSGRVFLAITRNPNQGADPPPHADSVVSASLKRSLIKGVTNGIAVFAINFAPRGAVDVKLEGNVIGGGLDADGGVCRPDAVVDSVVNIESHGNWYRSDGTQANPYGWLLHGGSTAPPNVNFGAGVPSSERNRLHMSSVDDRITGFVISVAAIAGERYTPLAGPPNDNRLNVEMVGTRMTGLSADLTLFGAVADGKYPPGNGNVLRMVLRDVERVPLPPDQESNFAGNAYVDEVAPPDYPGTGNRVNIAGNTTAFRRTDPSMAVPPAEVFSSSDDGGE